MNDVSIKEVNSNIIIFCLNEKNDFAKDVILSESALIIESINKVLKGNLNFKINIVDGEKPAKVNKENVEDHPLLDSAIETFNGKLI